MKASTKIHTTPALLYNSTLLFYVWRRLCIIFFLFFSGGGGVLLMFIKPVQFLLHEPYFDLTPIKVIHTKIYLLDFKTLLYDSFLVQTNCASTLNNNHKEKYYLIALGGEYIHMKSQINQTYCTYSFQRLTSG